LPECQEELKLHCVTQLAACEVGEGSSGVRVSGVCSCGSA
jgi:hypothetical protein